MELDGSYNQMYIFCSQVDESITRGLRSGYVTKIYRENVEALIKDINREKEAIKKHGIWVDGRHFKVKFTGN